MSSIIIYMKRWWNDKLKVSYILIAVLIVYLLIASILQKSPFLLVMKILPILLIVLIKVKISKSIKTEQERFEVNYKNGTPQMHAEIGTDIYYRIAEKEAHLPISDVKKVLETENLIIICFRGDLTLPLSKNGFVQGDARKCMEYLGK